MNELKRMYRLKTIFILLAIIIINSGLFMMSCDKNKKITLTGEELQTYIDEYPDFLQKTKTNSNLMKSMNMYQSGYAADNIIKTAERYSRLENVTLEAGENRGIVIFSDYALTDILLLAFLMIMATKLLIERRKGLVNMIRSTKNGREKLYLQRIGILFISAFSGGILLYGGNLIGSRIIYGASDFSRGLQSIPEFMLCPYKISISKYIIITCLSKIITCFLIALVFFLAISVFGTVAAYTATCLFAAAEILFYKLIIPVSALNSLRFINVVSIIKISDVFRTCQNINIFGKAVPAFTCDIVFLTAMLIICTLSGLYIHGKMYVQSKELFSGIDDRIKKTLEKIALSRTLFGWELYKTLIKQGGILFISAAFLLTYSASVKYKYVCLVNEYEEYYYNMFEGEITSEKLAAIEKKKINLEDTIASCRMEIEKLMQSENDNSTAIAALDFEIAEAESHLEGLMPVYENAKDGMEYIERTGHSIQLIKPYSYDLLLQRDRSTRTRASLYILIGIIGAVSGIFAFDRQNNMNASLRSAYRGRWKLNITKTAIVFAVSVILCLALHMIQFVQIGKMFGYNNITSPLQSLMFMRDWKLQISIREYLILLFAARSLSAFLIGIICMGISRICTDTVSAMGVSAFLLAVPAIFTEFISESVFFNPLNLISGTFLM